MARIYQPFAATVRREYALLERREYAGHTIELYRDNYGHGEDRWKPHATIIDNEERPMLWRNEDAAVAYLNRQIEFWDQMMEQAEADAEA